MMKNVLNYFYIKLVILFSFTFLDAQPVKKTSLSVLPHGVFKAQEYMRTDDDLVFSENGQFWCSFKQSMDKNMRRIIKDLTFYEHNTLLHTMPYVPGTDIEISNSGNMRISSLQFKEGGDLTIHFFSKGGKKQFTKKFTTASLFGFSPKGNKFGVGSHDKFEVFSIPSGEVETYPPTNQFAISPDESYVAIARERGIALYAQEKCIGEINQDLYVGYVRKITFSPDNSKVAFIGKRKLFVYRVLDLSKIFTDKVTGYRSYMDVKLENDHALTGIHLRNTETKMSHGILRTYSLITRSAISEREDANCKYKLDYSKVKYKYNQNSEKYEIPWPFNPPDKPQYAWNGYCQPVASNTGVSGGYLHQGLDMDVKTNQESYSVIKGFAKCYQTTSGAKHWRTVICSVNVAEKADGWLYAHLIQNTITVRPGDPVEKGELLGQIVHWSNSLVNGAHIHFSFVRDKGKEWSVNDANQWDNIANPMTYLMPKGDPHAPEILKFANDAKFGFSTNDNGSIKFLKPADLKGEIDMYVHIADRVGGSPWEQPAYAIYYWLRELSTGKIVKDRTIGHIRNQYMNLYKNAANTDYQILLPIMYRIDRTFPAIGWFDRNRHHVHNITNSGGDSLITRNGRKNALNTALYGDGQYRIYIEVGDAAGNKTLDSIDVTFTNGITSINTLSDDLVNEFRLGVMRVLKSIPTMQIAFTVPHTTEVTINVFNVEGTEITTLISGQYKRGRHFVEWEQTNPRGSGVYLIRMQADNYMTAEKCIIVR